MLDVDWFHFPAIIWYYLTASQNASENKEWTIQLSVEWDVKLINLCKILQIRLEPDKPSSASAWRRSITETEILKMKVFYSSGFWYILVSKWRCPFCSWGNYPAGIIHDQLTKSTYHEHGRRKCHTLLWNSKVCNYVGLCVKFHKYRIRRSCILVYSGAFLQCQVQKTPRSTQESKPTSPAPSSMKDQPLVDMTWERLGNDLGTRRSSSHDLGLMNCWCFRWWKTACYTLVQ